MTELDIKPVQVHMVKDDTKANTVKKEIRVSHHTYNIAVNAPVSVAGYDPNRVEMRVCVITGPVVLCDSVSAASDAANNTTGLANPNGRVLPQSTFEFIIPGPDPIFFAAPANTQVSVTIVRCNS